MQIGDKIRNAREDLDISQSEIAKLIPMNQSNYSKIERNLQEPSIEQLKKICQILRLDPRYLLDLNDFEMFSGAELLLYKDLQKCFEKHGFKIKK